MTRLFNEPAAFAGEMIEGFVAANSRWVRPVAGGVVRATGIEREKVAVVIGGGSGHYPAFAGLVGRGLAAGAAIGNVFASPSAQQVYSVSKAAENGGGVLFTFGNYAGDVLNFAQAQERLLAEGVPCRTVVVTDDVCSASLAEKGKRRGIAGDLTVFKVAAAAAEAGHSLDDVVEVAARANEATRSFGVAFDGCTLPGAAKPLFNVPAGRMAVGLGIHGEPGLKEVDVPTADGLAELFVATLLDELPDGVDAVEGRRVAVVLNGLGSVKYEELFVVYRRIAQLLGDAGITTVEPDVGEFCTSFDMAGASLTLMWLDEELERLWTAPAQSPAYRKGVLQPITPIEADEIDVPAGVETGITPGSPESQRTARTVVAALDAAAAVIDREVEELGRMDSVAGDGDHGIGMQRGIRAGVVAATRALHHGAGAGTVLEQAGDAWADQAGGTSGALWGVILRSVAAELGNDVTASGIAVARGVVSAKEGVMRFGKASVGDKTMVDALVPFADVLHAETERGGSLTQAWAAAAAAAGAAAAGTASLLPKMGRARPHGEKSLGTPDPGAHSLALIADAVAQLLTNIDREEQDG